MSRLCTSGRVGATHTSAVQACKFRDEYDVFKMAGAEVVGVSGDKPECVSMYIIIACDPS